MENLTPQYRDDTICALSTAPGAGAIAVIRLSGPETFAVTESIFTPAKKNLKLSEAASHTIHYGTISHTGEMIDEVVVSIFKKPHSYTGEDVIEISCHGSIYIQQKLIELLLKKGLRLAQPGEFTMRAFMNGKFDLSQAEAVADLITADSKKAHDLALDQMRGGFSSRIKDLRQQLVDFASLIELELDFSEEDVEFANRDELIKLLQTLKTEVTQLLNSFSVGNVLKKGIPVAIIGKTNVGKSTLLNAILNEEKAIVSEIPGTTRDVIEDTIIIEGTSFRFIDTAGLRHSEDKVESIGIERTYEKIRQAMIVLYVFDIVETPMEEIDEVIKEFREHVDDQNKRLILIGNKTDQLVKSPKTFRNLVELETIFVSAKRKENVNLILDSLVNAVNLEQYSDNAIVSNARHYEALSKALEAINSIEEGFNTDIPSDLIAIDIRQALHHLGEITGQISTDELLGNIFRNFCVGK